MRNVEKEKLDEIGKALIKAGSIRVQNIDEIVANPDLFDEIRKRISSETRGRRPSIGMMRPGFTVAGTILLIAVVSFAFFSLRSRPVQVSSKSVPQPAKTDEPKRFTNPDVVVQRPAVRDSAPIRPERVSMSRQSERSVTRPRPVSVRRVDDQNEFYALSYAGDPNETERGGRIVRVDISRATLFAMGFDLPLENESETVRADLLVGSDGVTRAVRVVK